MKTTKHKFSFSVAVGDVKDDTARLFAAVVKRHKGDVLGDAEMRGRHYYGASLTPSAAKLVLRDLSATNNGEVKMKDGGEDDGVRKSKPQPEPQPKAQTREVNERPPVIPPIEGAFALWDDIGSAAHKRAQSLLGECADPIMEKWGKFSISRERLCSAVRGRLKDKDLEEFKGIWFTASWRDIEPYVRKAFSKEDATFIIWHSTHSGRRIG